MVVTRSFTSSQLTTVAPGMILPNSVAKMARLIILLGHLEGIALTPAGKYGAGLRDMTAQRLFFNASHGNAAAIKQLAAYGTHISSHMSLSVAAPGTSSHGDGTRADWMFDGHDANAANIAFMERNDWKHEFGATDQNHFWYVGDRSGTVNDGDMNRVLGRWLNGRHLGRQTDAAITGKSDSDLIWLIQHAGHLDKTYPVKCVEDGITGPNTRATRKKMFAALLAKAA